MFTTENEKPLIVKFQGRVCAIEINRPHKRNALNSSALLSLFELLAHLEQEDKVRVLIIRGTGDKTFCSGFDIEEITTGPEGQEGDAGQGLIELTFTRLRNFKYPVIAMINGACAGAGLDLAANCDFRIAVEDACLGITPAKLGVMYQAAGVNRFVQLVGLAATKELFYTGRLVSASRALEMGLVDQVVSPSKLQETVFSLAEEIADNAPLSVAGSKYIINSLTEKLPLTAEEHVEIQRMALQAFQSEDLVEGRSAFLQKRKPLFKGR